MACAIKKAQWFLNQQSLPKTRGPLNPTVAPPSPPTATQAHAQVEQTTSASAPFPHAAPG